MATGKLGAMVMRPVLLEKVWGGRSLEKLGKMLPAGGKIGESWELADMQSTSASGAGGGAIVSTIARGAMAGKSVHEVLAEFGDELMGPGWMARERGAVPGKSTPSFPLLVKFLDAQENLSVQVHPSAKYAAEHPGAFLKTECWHVVDARPGAKLYIGLREGVTRSEFSRRARAHDAGVVELLRSVPAIKGECHNLPSGTVHALGAGVVIAEVQTPSDTTFRVFDWGRTGRALHVEESLECMTFAGEAGYDELVRGMTRRSMTPGGAGGTGAKGAGASELVRTAFFHVQGVRGGLEQVGQGRAREAHSCVVIIVTHGQGGVQDVRSEGGGEDLNVSAGDCVLVPASSAEQSRVEDQGDLELLTVRL